MTSVSEKPQYSRDLYPMTKPKSKKAPTNNLPPISGFYEGKSTSDQTGQGRLELKIDVDQIKPHSEVLNIISGTIIKSSNEFFNLENANGLYLRSIAETTKFHKIQDGDVVNDRRMTCDILATRTDGRSFKGVLCIDLCLPHGDDVWRGSCKVKIGDKCAAFDCVRTSSYFRRFSIAIDYIDEIIWPTIDLSKFYDVPQKLKDRKIDPVSAFEDAGVKMIFNRKDCFKVKDPTPDAPWTKNEMFELMTSSKAKTVGGLEAVWFMLANQPSDNKCMGYSFNKDDFNGFGLFLGNSSFNGISRQCNERHNYAMRRLLHYIVRGCGQALGLKESFQLGKLQDLSWMNYSHKYDAINGSGKFFSRFKFCFSKKELEQLRHSPSIEFQNSSLPTTKVSNYDVVKSLPVSNNIETDETDTISKKSHLSLQIKVKRTSLHVGNLVELQVQIKNLGDVGVMIEKYLSLEHGHLLLYITDPCGNVKHCQPFSKTMSRTSQSDPILLRPYGDNDGKDEYTQLIVIGEGALGSEFDIPGNYTLQAKYIYKEESIVSNVESLKIIEDEFQFVFVGRSANVASILGGLTHTHSKPALDEWKKLCSMTPKEKDLIFHKIYSVLDEILTGQVRVVSEKNRKIREIETKTVPVSARDFLIATDDMLKYYHEEGTSAENLHYIMLVIARAKANKSLQNKNSDLEFQQLVADLLLRGVNSANVNLILEEKVKISSSDQPEKKTTSSFLQKRVEEILDWYPVHIVKGKKDLSGIGLGKLLSHFQEDHVIATSKIARMLFDKLDETNDLNEVLDYADNLQRSHQVNHHVLQWAVEIFIIHSKVAKKNGIKYPSPKDRDHTLSTTKLALTERSGEPQESWLNYWRSDADLNYHHRHWHSVYIVGRYIGQNVDWFGNWRQKRPELERQGELFTYMHQQMLARYLVERRSWGLSYVQPWLYGDKDPLGYNAGYEFHHYPGHADFAPRPPASWPIEEQKRFRDWEEKFLKACDDGVLPPVYIAGKKDPVIMELDFNLSGHILEASSNTWKNFVGNIHNEGHNVFGTNLVIGESYMFSTVTAMRDHIFYRWHQHIDDLWQYWNNTQITEVASDAPPVVLSSNDVVLKKSSNPLDGFSDFSKEAYFSDEMSTFLGPPLKRFERDLKLSHDPFYYHIRFKRTAPGNLNLTFRLFICPLRDVNNRTMWIEMDKFVFRLPSDQESAVIIRPDRHSSVIKRIPSEMQGNVETNSTDMVSGFCECGWPYNMLLPRGTANGEEWRLCVFVSDNGLDNIEVRSSCGSLSFCGASGQQYPDKRPMGYPFTTDMSINGEKMPITDAISSLSSAALCPFVIRNNVVTNLSPSLVTLWSPWVQLLQNDGTDNPISPPDTAYKPSQLIGRLRVLIDSSAMSLAESTNRINVRFHGRGEGNGSYHVNGGTAALRSGTSLNIASGTKASVITAGGQASFDVPEYGLISDDVTISHFEGDLFITFTITSGGSYLMGKGGMGASTWAIRNPTGKSATTENWNNLSDVIPSSSIYCVGGLMMPQPLH